jgi:hypothetical protein
MLRSTQATRLRWRRPTPKRPLFFRQELSVTGQKGAETLFGGFIKGGVKNHKITVKGGEQKISLFGFTLTQIKT